jgi:GT2 family glycosyltransferase
MNIAVIITCHNRKEKTIKCLEHLFEALEYFNAHGSKQIALSVYLTDDGCSDGTAMSIRQKFADRDITILQGNGNLYWAGGMRLAWREALKKHSSWDFYLLANDDTYAFPSLFEEFDDTLLYCMAKHGVAGVYSAVTISQKAPEVVTYGGARSDRWGRLYRLQPAGKPLRAEITNANFLLVAASVVDKIGIFYEGYQHGCADNDYAIQANKHGIPVYITGHPCAYCEFDHKGQDEETKMLTSMSLKERREYLAHPLHSEKEYLVYMRRNFPMKYPFAWVVRTIRLLAPALYYKINQLRGIYK